MLIRSRLMSFPTLDEFKAATSHSDALFMQFADQVLNCDYDADDNIPKDSFIQLVSKSYELLADQTINADKINIAFSSFQIDFEDKIEAQKNKTLLLINMEDKPFIVDSVIAQLTSEEKSIRYILHPIMTIEHNSKGEMVKISPAIKDHKEQKQSIVIILLEDELSLEQTEDLYSKIYHTLADVNLAVSYWAKMKARVTAVIDELRTSPPMISANELAESIQFLEWLNDDHFVFLGMRELNITKQDDTSVLKHIDGSSLGILKNPESRVLKLGGKAVTVTPEIDDFLRTKSPLIVTKSDLISKVHRRTVADYIGVKRYNKEGDLIGELRIVGLFTATTYSQPVNTIPLLRKKQTNLIQKLDINDTSHIKRSVIRLLNGYPRTELFQTDDDYLLKIIPKLLRLQERPKTKVFLRKDRFSRYITAQVFIKRERYNSSVRMKVGQALCHAFGGDVLKFEPTFLASGLTRVYFVISIHNKMHSSLADISANTEMLIKELTTGWEDYYQECALMNVKQATSQPLAAECFSEAYRSEFDAHTAIKHSSIIQSLNDNLEIASYFERSNTRAQEINLFIFKRNQPLTLSERVPVLENMGFNVISEDTCRIYTHQHSKLGADCTLYKMRLMPNKSNLTITKRDSYRLEECLLSILQNHTDNDPLNALCLKESLSWREISILRIYIRHQFQLGISYSLGFMQKILAENGAIARKLIEIFHYKFDPTLNLSMVERDQQLSLHTENFDDLLSKVSNLEEDSLLKRIKSVLDATLRTNYYIPKPKQQPLLLSIKLSPKDIEDIPSPKPYREIFVSGPQIEGVHMRFGPIARGGLRWSDRSQDFRTEILGLVKAQQVKNAVIVPVGSKGGFISRIAPVDNSREAFMNNGIAAYKLFIASLLEITDNQTQDMITQPEHIIAWDQKDPYLVVAADKGTATFSDIANGISQEKEFWLDDAFASGGSAGYDHKKMGITARGGWEAVKRHFREMDWDIQSTPFTAMGVGDMSGDVFGNGMLLSKFTKLQAAFDHRHIFIDPNPDYETSYIERKRLFDLGRSSWDDYDKALLSDGGGVYSRTEKSITLSQEAKNMLKLEGQSHTPQTIMTAILQASVDLLWFGGIGTYIKNSLETDADVGDKNNDAIRISAVQINAKVIGEGANLGVTQLGRIEFAEHGGRINTDAIDNSAGVNSSDLEVNIKIAFQALMSAGDIDRNNRNIILEQMTERVSELVLKNSYRQTLSITLSQNRGIGDLGFQNASMQWLDKNFALEREVEFLPSTAQMQERMIEQKLFSRPELAVLLAYMKNALFADLENFERLEDDIFKVMLLEYFPEYMQENYKPTLLNHKLKKGIIATELCNGVINRGGLTFPIRMQMETGANLRELSIGYIIARDSFGILDAFKSVEQQDNLISSEQQINLFSNIQNHLFTTASWILRETNINLPLGQQIEQVSHFANTLRDALLNKQVLCAEKQKELETKIAYYKEIGIAKPELLATLSFVESLLALYNMNIETNAMAEIIKQQYKLDRQIGLERLTSKFDDMILNSLYDRLALNRLKTSLFTSLSRLAVSQSLHEQHNDKNALDQLTNMISDLSQGPFDIARLTVVAGMLDDLASKSGA